METWQLIVTICAGIITLLTFFEKIGLTKKVKKVDEDHVQLKKLLSEFGNVQNTLTEVKELALTQNQALLAILRNDLYRCFKTNRDIGAWTDDECRVQTRMHEAYKTLKGNGEETIWWEKKTRWKIVSEEEHQELLRKHN